MRTVIVPPPAGALRPDEGASVTRLGGSTMGTTWSAAFTHPVVAADTAQAAIQKALDGVVVQMSSWEPQADLCRYNAAPVGAWVELPDDLLTVVDAALAVAAETDGAFDPTLGALVDLWGFGPAPFTGAPPTPAQIATALQCCGWRKLRREGSRLWQPGGLRLDLSGIAKGFGVDTAVAAIDGLGICNALIEVGGEMKGIGCKPDGSPWWAQLETPPGAQGGAEVMVALSGWALATSADHRRSFVHDEARYGHTLDPATSAPRQGAILSASVIHTSCMLADAYATAALVMTPEAMGMLANAKAFASLTMDATGTKASDALLRWANG